MGVLPLLEGLPPLLLTVAGLLREEGEGAPPMGEAPGGGLINISFPGERWNNILIFYD